MTAGERTREVLCIIIIIQMGDEGDSFVFLFVTSQSCIAAAIFITME